MKRSLVGSSAQGCFACRFARLLAALVLVSVFGGSSLVWAYAPPAAFILKTLVSKREMTKAVRIRSTLKVFDAEKSEPLHFKLNHLYRPDTGILRTTMTDEAGRTLYHFEHDMRGQSVLLGAPVQAIAVLLLDPQWVKVVQILRNQGLRIPSLAVLETEPEVAPHVASHGAGATLPDEPATTSAVLKPVAQPSTFLARWNKTIAWVIGEKKTGAQLWVEKDTFLPLRWVDKTELEFENFKLFRDLPYPRVISFAENKKLLLKEELIDLKSPAPDPNKGRSDPSHGFTDAGMELAPSTRALIQRYFEPL